MSATPATSSSQSGAGLWPDLGLARRVELSEARAYSSLFAALQAQSPELGFSTHSVGMATVLRATQVTTSLLVNRVLGLGLGGPATPATEADLDAIVHAYGQGKEAFGIELSPAAQPAELPTWMRARRLRKAFPAQVLIRGNAAPPDRYAAWAKATGLRVVAVGPEQAPTLARLCCSNFNMPDALLPLLAVGCVAPGWRRWLALDGDVPVGGSLSFVAPAPSTDQSGPETIGWLGWTSVAPSHRGRWVHAGIVAKQLEDCHAAGCDWVTTETSASSKEKPDAAHHNLRNFGFQDAYLRPVYVYQPPRPPLLPVAVVSPSAPHA
jgi:GNAT superfamily N-acetyltransferase